MKNISPLRYPGGKSQVYDYVRELVVGLIVLDIGVLHVGGVDAIDDRSHLGAGDGVLREEGAIFVALKDLHASENFDGFSISLVNVLDILKSCVGADGQRQSHDQSQHHCE